jgi:hypothetical protein
MRATNRAATYTPPEAGEVGLLYFNVIEPISPGNIFRAARATVAKRMMI